MRRLARIVSSVAAIVLGLLLLRPVIVAPITGDDTYYDLHAASVAHVSQFLDLSEEWHTRVNKGRVNVITGIERNLSGRAVVDTAVSTGRQPRQVQAGFRVVFLALALAAVYLLLRTLRWRRRDTGELVRLGARPRSLALILGGLLFAAGAQPQIVGLHGFNGWLSYPVLTLTAPLSIFGVAALALWLARLGAARGWQVVVPGALLMLLIGALTNFRYELNFVALPVVVLALLLVPVSPRQQRAAGRRAKLIVGLAYVVGFVPVLLADRVMLSHVCARQSCYTGVRPSVHLDIVSTFAFNVVSTIPGVGRAKTEALLRGQGLDPHGLWTPTVWSLLLALGLLAVLALAWWSRRPQAADQRARTGDRRAQGVLCVVAAVLFVAGALGTAAVMSLSQEAQGHTDKLGLLFRNAPSTWLGLAVGLVLLVLAIGLLKPGLAVPSYVVVALVVALLVAGKAPADLRIAGANNSYMQASNQVYTEMVRGQHGAAANQRRCHLLVRVKHDFSPFYSSSIRHNADLAFRHLWQAPFCARN